LLPENHGFISGTVSTYPSIQQCSLLSILPLKWGLASTTVYLFSSINCLDNVSTNSIDLEKCTYKVGINDGLPRSILSTAFARPFVFGIDAPALRFIPCSDQAE